jgi:hypothetical protein
VVHFAKNGITAHTVGVGEMVLSNCYGPMVPLEVLHVQALQDPFFSVRAALARRMSVLHFCSGKQPGNQDHVVVTHGGSLWLTARLCNRVYFLDEYCHEMC